MRIHLKNDIKIWGESIWVACYNARENLSIQIGEELDGACAIASYFLKQKIKDEYNIKVHFICGEYLDFNIGYNHCWLEIENTIIDTTKTQFGSLERVSFSEINDENYIAELYNLSAIQKVKNWESQNPLLYKMKWKKEIAKLIQK